MDSFHTGILTALWLGVLTSISPCPLATNIAAISYIGRRVSDIRRVILSGVAYSLGRILTYVIVGGIVVGGLLSIPSVSIFLQRYMIMIIGPLLVLAGMFLLELITIGWSGGNMGDVAAKHAGDGGLGASALMGLLFALSFCPVSAALFFGSLIPLAVSRESAILLPSLYGIGTGLPVLVFAVLIAAGAKSIGVVFNSLTVFELWARRITGIILISIGVYLSLKYVFHIL